MDAAARRRPGARVASHRAGGPRSGWSRWSWLSWSWCVAVSSLQRAAPVAVVPNPFATRQVDRSQPVLLKAIEDLEVFKAASGNFQVVVDLEEGSRGIPLILKGQRTLFLAGGSVDAEVDFSSLEQGRDQGLRRREAGRHHPAEGPAHQGPGRP